MCSTTIQCQDVVEGNNDNTGPEPEKRKLSIIISMQYPDNNFGSEIVFSKLLLDDITTGPKIAMGEIDI